MRNSTVPDCASLGGGALSSHSSVIYMILNYCGIQCYCRQWGLFLKVKCSIIYLSFMTPAPMKTIIPSYDVFAFPVNDDPLFANSSNANKGLLSRGFYF